MFDACPSFFHHLRELELRKTLFWSGSRGDKHPGDPAQLTSCTFPGSRGPIPCISYYSNPSLLFWYHTRLCTVLKRHVQQDECETFGHFTPLRKKSARKLEGGPKCLLCKECQRIQMFSKTRNKERTKVKGRWSWWIAGVGWYSSSQPLGDSGGQLTGIRSCHLICPDLVFAFDDLFDYFNAIRTCSGEFCSYRENCPGNTQWKKKPSSGLKGCLLTIIHLSLQCAATGEY